MNDREDMALHPSPIAAKGGLLPCPFCGCEAQRVVFSKGQANERHGVRCADLTCGGLVRLGTQPGESEALWNSRTPAPSLGEDVVDLLSSFESAIRVGEGFSAGGRGKELSAIRVSELRDKLLAALSPMRPVQEEGVGEDGDICRRCRGRHVVPDNIDPFGYPEDRPCPACTDGTWKGVAALAARRDVSEVLKKHEPAIRAAASALASHPEASPPSLGVEELREALEPFARIAEDRDRRDAVYGQRRHDGYTCAVPLGRLRKARAALSRVSGGV